MIAIIRIRDQEHSKELCQLDLMRFSEDQVRERMRERGIRDDAFFICGFIDWDVNNIMSLELAYALKRCILELYNGDETLVADLLKRHVLPAAIISRYYRFISRDEYEVASYLLEHTNISQFMVAKALEDELLVSTKNGFYLVDTTI